MSLVLIIITFGITFLPSVLYSLPIGDKNSAEMYLKYFGYLKGPSRLEDQEVSNAIKDFQKFAGLEETGELDNETISMMNVPRCGVKDKIPHDESTMKKRYILEGSKWHVNEITYFISKYPSGIKDKTKVRNEIARAFKLWSDVTTLNFKEKPRRPVNIDIRFEIGYHGDGEPFDGPGWTLAHAAFPQYGGHAHFDDGEIWTINERYGTNLFQVAAHQFGHSLGLLHSDETQALMFPFYQGYRPELQLHPDEILAIQVLYGSRKQPQSSDDKVVVDIQPQSPDDKVVADIQPQSPDDKVVADIQPQSSAGEAAVDIESPSHSENASDICYDATLDTITRTQSGSTYAFKGDYYWELLPSGTIREGYPRKISEDWDGLEGNLDASFTWSNGTTFFFKGKRFWRFINKRMDGSYPKLISEVFKGIPDDVDAAVVWGGNGKIYIFKGNKYWRYDINVNPPVNRDYPMALKEWSSRLGNSINAAVLWDNNNTYFFKGNLYYRYDDKTSEIATDPTYPLSTAKEWFGCRVA